jgi:hypothetical protein
VDDGSRPLPHDDSWEQNAQAIFFRRRHQPRRPPIFRVMIALNYPWR